MSRIGRKPIVIPKSVRVAVEGHAVGVEGPKGKLSHSVPGVLTVEVKDGQLQVGRTSDHRSARAYRRCKLCGRPRGYLRKFEMCRICFRELALKGEVPGVIKASW